MQNEVKAPQKFQTTFNMVANKEVSYRTGDQIRFTMEARMGGLAMRESPKKKNPGIHRIAAVKRVPEGFCTGEHGLQLTYHQGVGHSQWVILKDGQMYSGALVEPIVK